MHSVLVQDFTHWRSEARALLARGIPPGQVRWQVGATGDADLFAAGYLDGPADSPPPSTDVPAPVLRVPRSLLQQLEMASRYRSENGTVRYDLLYKILWRWQCGERDVLSPADADGAQLAAMVKAVRREEHDLHAYVRFRERAADDGPRFVAWIEPRHDVLLQVGRHFAERMGRTTWMIATPQATLAWDGEALEYGDPLPQAPGIDDDHGEALWLAYYRSIFNPARLNARLLQSHIPSRHWKNLPEGRIVPAMIKNAAAGERSLGQAASVGRRQGSVIPIAPDAAQPARQDLHRLDQCRRCELWEHASQAVPGHGNTAARVMLVAEQPGDQEDLAGQPLVGPAGKLLDEALAAAGVARDSLYLTNAVKHFRWEARGKRRIHKSPSQRHIDACHAWLDQELAEVGPRVIVAMGSTALHAVTGARAGKMADWLGKPLERDGRTVVACYHPSYVLRLRDEAERARAFRAIVEALECAKRLAG